MDDPTLPFAPSFRIIFPVTPSIPFAMRARVVPPYPSFAYVMSQIADESQENRSGFKQPYGDLLVMPVPAPRRPYSKYDDNPFMVRWRVPI